MAIRRTDWVQLRNLLAATCALRGLGYCVGNAPARAIGQSGRMRAMTRREVV